MVSVMLYPCIVSCSVNGSVLCVTCVIVVVNCLVK